MKETTSSVKPLRIPEVFGSLWKLLKQNYLLWLFLFAIMDFVSWNLVDESWDAIVRYSAYRFPFDLPDFATGPIREFSKHLAVFVSAFGPFISQTIMYFCLSQVVLCPLVLQALSNQSKIESDQVLASFQRSDFILDILRTLGIIVIYYALFALVFLVPLAMIFHSVPIAITGTVVVVLYCGSIYAAFRSILAIPVTVLENVSVVKSITRSWRITGEYGKALLVILLVTYIAPNILLTSIFAAISPFVIVQPPISDLPLIFWITNIILTGLFSISVAAIYFHVMRSQEPASY